jgi:hypothetical protein
MSIRRPPQASEFSSDLGLDAGDLDMPESSDDSDAFYGSDDDNVPARDADRVSSPDDSSPPDGLSSLRRMCRELGYDSILAAAVAEAEAVRACKSSAPKKYMGLIRRDLDVLCRIYLELGVFSKCPKKINNGLGGGACALSLPILVHQFERLRLHHLLNIVPNIGTDDFHTSFDLPHIYEVLGKEFPEFIGFITSMLDTAESTTQEAKRFVVIVVAMLANARNSHCNYIQKVLGMYLYALKTPKRAIASLNHIGLCVSHSTLLRDLKEASNGARNRLRALGSTGLAFIPVFDNLTFKARVRQERLDNQAEFMTFTAGYVLVPPATRSMPMFNRHTDIKEANIDTLALLDFVPTGSDHENVRLAFRAIIWQTLTEFAQFEKVKLAKLDCELPEINRIDSSDLPDLLPLPTYDLNEAVCNDMIKILEKIQQDTGLSVDQCKQGLQFYAGDLMTVEGMR